MRSHPHVSVSYDDGVTFWTVASPSSDFIVETIRVAGRRVSLVLVDVAEASHPQLRLPTGPAPWRVYPQGPWVGLDRLAALASVVSFRTRGNLVRVVLDGDWRSETNA